VVDPQHRVGAPLRWSIRAIESAHRCSAVDPRHRVGAPLRWLIRAIESAHRCSAVDPRHRVGAPLLGGQSAPPSRRPLRGS